MRVHKVARRLLKIQTLRVSQGFGNALGILVHDAAHTMHDPLKIDALDGCLDTQPMGLLDLHHPVCRGDQELAGDTSYVQAGAAHSAMVDKRDTLAMI
jgi:hypothetical protein